MASASGPPKDQEPVHRRGQRERQESTSSSSAAAAQGGAAASLRGRAPRPPSQGRPPTPPRRSTVESLTQGRAHEQPGGGGRGTGGSSSAAAAVDQKGKRKIGEGSSSPPPDNREQAQRKSEPPKEKLLGSSMRALRSHAKKLSDSPISPELSHPDAEDAVKDIELVMNLGRCMETGNEQVLDREDTDEEQRLLAAVEVEVKPMAMQIDYPEMATAFSWSHEVFKKLIENVIRWKSIQNGVASTDSRKQELLNFFSSKSTSNGSKKNILESTFLGFILILCF
ncbi:hypothetical protein E2562_011353 [Oryza meyeriana var. granulata]|uniref:Uncharacterized protein n=1 Tax=Oryza meyeriana var. granulata TaxID=110450 RepID=A0A6G1BWB1_9ORYZ|nr:hypothetical protein E2562_011353 [Oryza meyeriana var. granulata]